MADPAAPEPAVWRFGAFEVRAAQRQVYADGRPLALGARAFDVLLYLLRHRQRVVPKSELLDAVWPGLVVEENNLSVQVSGLRKALGAEVIATVAGRGYQFVAGTDLAERAAAPAPVASAPTLFGRVADAAALRAGLVQHSLLCLVGPAGVGKTALARQLVASWPQPATWVELTALPAEADRDAVAAAVAQALALPGGRAPLRLRLQAHLAAAPADALVVLDNCEHLAASVAALLSDWHQAAPHLHVLATSQIPLKLPHERVQRLAPLQLAAPGTHYALEDAVAEPAVALFMAQVQRLAPQLSLHAGNLADVLAICQQLDGLPLALQLAAARVPLLGIHGVRTRLGTCLRLLTQGPATPQASHRALAAALDWSHALLTEPEQLLLRRLAVCAGPFDADLAQAVAVAPPLDEWAVLDGLSALLDHSLLAQLAGGGDAPSFMLLDTVRRYALARLAASGETEATSLRHAQHMAAVADTHGGGHVGDARAGAARAPLLAQLANLRAALDWATEADPALALRLASALMPLWQERGHHREALARCERILAATADDPSLDPSRHRVCLRLAMLETELDDAAAVARWADAGMTIAQRLGDAAGIAVSHGLQGHAAFLRGDLAAARGHFGAVLAHQRGCGSAMEIAQELNNLADCWCHEGRPDEARALVREALPLARQAGSRWHEQAILDTEAMAAVQQGQWVEARTLMVQALALCRTLAHQWHTRNRLLALALIDAALQRHAEARASLDEALALEAAHRYADGSARQLTVAAALRLAVGEAADAVAMLGAAAHEAGQTRSPPLPATTALTACLQTQTRAALSETDWQAAWARGQGWPPEAVGEALSRACEPRRGA